MFFGRTMLNPINTLSTKTKKKQTKLQPSADNLQMYILTKYKYLNGLFHIFYYLENGH